MFILVFSFNFLNIDLKYDKLIIGMIRSNNIFVKCRSTFTVYRFIVNFNDLSHHWNLWVQLIQPTN